MIRSLQAIFYVTWVIVGVLIIISAFAFIASFPFEKINDYLKTGTTEQRDLTGPPEQFGSRQESGPGDSSMNEGGSSINFIVTDEMRREMAKVIGEERARQFQGYDNLTPEEVKKLEDYWGPRTPWLGQK